MARSACLTVSEPCSPVRMRTASSTSMTKILPSPTSPWSPVRAASASLSTTVFTISACITASTFRRGRSEMWTEAPRYFSVYPRCAPQPLTSVTVTPETPHSSRTSCTSCRRSCRMIAITIFMLLSPHFGRSVRVDRRCIGRPVNAPWHRHERFGVAPHAVFADVQAFHLLARRDAEADGLLDDPEEPVAEDEHGQERCRHGDRLGTKLVQAAGVEEATLADAVELGERRDGEQAAAESAPDAGQAVGRQRPDWVVEDLVEGEHAYHHDHAGDRADHDRGPRLDVTGWH